MIFWCDKQTAYDLNKENSVDLAIAQPTRMKGYVTLLYHPMRDGFIDILPRDMLSVMFIATTTPIDQKPVKGWYRCCKTTHAKWLLSTLQIRNSRGSMCQPLPYDIHTLLQRKNVSRYIKVEDGYICANTEYFCFRDHSITGVNSAEKLLQISLSKEMIRGLIYSIRESYGAVALGCWMISLQLLNPTYNIMTTKPLTKYGKTPPSASLYDIKTLCHLNESFAEECKPGGKDESKILLSYGDSVLPSEDEDMQGMWVLKPLVKSWFGDISQHLILPQLWTSGNAYGDPQSKQRGYSFPLNVLIGDELYDKLHQVGLKNLTLPTKWRW